MRKHFSVATLALVLALSVAAPAAFANGSAQNTKLRMTLADLPATVSPGESMRARLSLENLTGEFKSVNLNFSLVTPLGNLPIRSGTINLSPHASKAKRSSFTVTEDAKPGNYRIVITGTVDNQVLTVAHDFTVVPK